MSECLILTPTGTSRRFRMADGQIVTPPAGWACLPPGDAGLTRRVKLAGPSWQVQEKRGSKMFSRGLWAPAETIARIREELQQERSTVAYARRKEADASRRAEKQNAYVGEFSLAVLDFLRFSPVYATQALKLSEQVVAHATPVGSGTVARTQRISVDARAAAAVIAWMRHRTTAYESMKIARVKGRRREVRRELAEVSRRLLDRHRTVEMHTQAECALCRALAE